MAAEGWGEEKFIPRGRSTVKNKERGGGRGVKSSGGRGRGRGEKTKKIKTVGVARVTCSKKNYLISLPFEGVNPETEIWQQVNDIRESSLTFLDFSVINNSHNQ